MKIENIATLSHNDIEHALVLYVRQQTGKMAGNVEVQVMQFPSLGRKQELRAVLTLTEVPNLAPEGGS